jgi:chromosomal replication initiation ATPase DnaA
MHWGCKSKFDELEFKCTVELSHQTFPNLKSYSLEYLSQFLNLKVDGNFFNKELAHRAVYDAKFTYKLFKKIQEVNMVKKIKSNKSQNPFLSNRVDTPFQEYPDIENIYKNEFSILIDSLNQIKNDTINNQSKGVVIVGDAGSGKTHIIMRLAKKRLNSNRLFFIRQPNNEKTVIYRFYRFSMFG